MASKNEIEKLQADLKENPELAKKINGSILNILIDLLKVLGYNITKEDLEEAVKLKGDSGEVNAAILWERYVIIN